jgi:hypothetical protein
MTSNKGVCEHAAKMGVLSARGMSEPRGLPKTTIAERFNKARKAKKVGMGFFDVCPVCSPECLAMKEGRSLPNMVLTLSPKRAAYDKSIYISSRRS